MLPQRVRVPPSLQPSRIPLCERSTAVPSTPLRAGTGCFQSLVMVNNAAVNTGVHRVCQVSVWGFFGYVPKSGIAGSKGSSIFNFLRKLHAASHSGCARLHPTSRAQGSASSTSSPALVVCWRSGGIHSDSCAVVSHVVLICVSDD